MGPKKTKSVITGVDLLELKCSKAIENLLNELGDSIEQIEITIEEPPKKVWRVLRSVGLWGGVRTVEKIEKDGSATLSLSWNSKTRQLKRGEVMTDLGPATPSR